MDNLPAGIKNIQDPFVSYSYIEILLKQKNTGQPLFDYDLGLTLPDLSDPGCVFESGLIATLKQRLSCILNYGSQNPTINDWVMVRIKNYAPLIPPSTGQRIKFSIPVQYPNSVGVVPQVMVRLTRYDRKKQTTIRTQTYQLGSAKTIPGLPLPSSNLQGPLLT